MARRLSRWTLILFLGCFSMATVGCASEVFGPEFGQFIRDTAKETAISVGNFVVENAITSRFD